MSFVVSKELLNKPKKEKYWITYIRQRISKNQNFLGFISGQTGSGKSWASLSLAEQLDNDFNEKNVVFNAEELMDLINAGTLKRGSVIVFEESGVEFNNKSWASITNKTINYLLQTFRHKGFILIMNSPYMDFLDSGMRKLFHAEFQTISIDRNKGSCKLKPQLLEYNARHSKMYYKRLQVRTLKGFVPISFLNVCKPSPELINVYEAKKTAFTTKLNNDISEMLRLDRLKKIPKELRPVNLTNVQTETLDMLKKGFNRNDIIEARGIDKAAISRTMQSLNRLGYEFKPQYDGKKVKSYDVVEPKTQGANI